MNNRKLYVAPSAQLTLLIPNEEISTVFGWNWGGFSGATASVTSTDVPIWTDDKPWQFTQSTASYNKD